MVSQHQTTARAQTPETGTPSPQRTYEDYRRIFAGRPMPFAFLDLNLFDANVRAVLAGSGKKRIRVASKSVRSVAVLRRVLAADPRIQGVMCFTVREAIYLARQGFTDLLVGYPATGANDLDAVAEAIAGGAEITLMADCIEHVDRIEQTASAHNVTIPVCLEYDMSLDVPGLHFGVWRSPLRSLDAARAVAQRIQSAPHIRLDGIMGYEAQIAGVGDNASGQRVKNTLIRALKRRSIPEIRRRRGALVKMLAEMGVSLRFVNGGGTGSLASTRDDTAVTEITVGSAFYAPALFDLYREFRYLPAAGYAIEIVRQPARSLYTCLGGGYTASGAAGVDKLPRPYLPQGARLLSLEGAGEVQTPVRYAGPVRLGLGDPIFMRHAKAGELCERFTTLALVQGNAVVDEATTYRGDGQCFL